MIPALTWRDDPAPVARRLVVAAESGRLTEGQRRDLVKRIQTMPGRVQGWIWAQLKKSLSPSDYRNLRQIRRAARV